jgi:hypothetical protein
MIRSLYALCFHRVRNIFYQIPIVASHFLACGPSNKGGRDYNPITLNNLEDLRLAFPIKNNIMFVDVS